MIPEGPAGIGQGGRAALTALAFAATTLIIYALFSSGFGRPRPAPVEGPVMVGASVAEATLAVVSDDLWLTYLPAGLERSGGGPVKPKGSWARFGSAQRFVEAQVEPAADWVSYTRKAALLDARPVTVRGRPAVVGRHPNGGRMIIWMERAGTGAWIRVSDSLGGELVAIAASVKSPVGD